MKHAIIIGSEGQDGHILFDQLSQRGDAVLGIGRGKVRAQGSFASTIGSTPIDVLNAKQLSGAMSIFAPDEIYYLAAFHHSSEDAAVATTPELFARSHDIHVVGLLNTLEVMRRAAPQARLFYAASSHVFGAPPGLDQNEQTPLNPNNVYGITKTTGIHCCRFYRQFHGLHASVGILFNHESSFRPPQFLSRKIVRAAVAIQRKLQDRLVIGDLSAIVDWGYAPDYTDAMMRILSLDQPDDFVIATGQPHQVGEFAAAAFNAVGLDWQTYVSEDPSLIHKSKVRLVGNATHLRQLTGWKPSVTFEEMVRLLVRAEEAKP